MDAIAAKLSEYLREYGLPKSGESVLVACSGGADSLALLLLLHEQSAMLGIRLGCAHYDHGFRGAESREDLDFVHARAAALGIPFHAESADLSAVLAREGGNAQDLARRMRYTFLERVRERAGYDRIALAHTADDQAETVLYKFLRGASISALAGMPSHNGRVIRPLFFAQRSEVEAYLRARNQSWREDSSNKKLIYRRNLLRLQVMPELERHFPGLRRHLDELASEAAAWARDMDSLASRMEVRSEEDGVSWALQDLRSAPPSLARYILAQQFAQQTPSVSDLPQRAAYHAWVKRIMDTRGGLLYHGRAGTLSIHRGRLYCARPYAESFYQTLQETYPVREGEIAFAWGTLRVAQAIVPENAGKKFFQEQALKGIFWLGKMANGLVLRSARSGESIELARNVHTKAADILSASGVPLPLRRTAFVLAFENGSAAALFVPAMLKLGRIGSVLHAEAGRPALCLSFALPEA
ncbi:MAG: tRNA lysidine(34) synthetase TilS [Spirochaetota bacterium]|jgi:tRNA(Ile)-lysidine synthase|nr:tRNA lysidine(34) synthetase TilS [Spirochaetota bacterium]